MATFKYEFINDDEGIVIFPSSYNHSYIAGGYTTVISAGTIEIYQGYFPKGWKPEDGCPDPQIAVKHGSVTLGIDYNKEREDIDQKLIELFLKPSV